MIASPLSVASAPPQGTTLPHLHFVVNSLHIGGAERHTVELAADLSRRGFAVGLTYLKRAEHLLPKLLAVGEVAVDCVDCGRGLDFGALRRLAATLERRKPGIIVAVNQYPLVYACLGRLAARSGARLASVFHSSSHLVRRDRLLFPAYRRFFRQCDEVVFLSDRQRQHWASQGLHAPRSYVIHNGTRTDHFADTYSQEQKRVLRSKLGLEETDFLVAVNAVLRPEKRHADVLDAIRILTDRGIPARGLLIGDGGMRSEIESHIARLGLERAVRITGFQDDVRPWLAMSDVLVLASATETFSLAVLEGMAMGKPVVCSNVGAAAEQVADGEQGFLYPCGDVVTLADRLACLTVSETRQHMGDKARRTAVERFDFSRMVDRYAETFAELDRHGG